MQVCRGFFFFFATFLFATFYFCNIFFCNIAATCHSMSSFCFVWSREGSNVLAIVQSQPAARAAKLPFSSTWVKSREQQLQVFRAARHLFIQLPIIQQSIKHMSTFRVRYERPGAAPFVRSVVSVASKSKCIQGDFC